MPWVKGIRGTGDFIEVDDNVRFMGTTEFMDDNPIGDTYYVRNGTGSDSANGVTPGTAFNTLEYAVHHAADDWDKIIVFPAEADTQPAYLMEATQAVDDDSVPINITQTGLKILGQQTHWMKQGSPTIHTHVAAQGVFTVNAYDVEIAGLTIQVQGAGGYGIKIGTSQTVWRTHIHHCNLVAYGAGIYGIMFGAGIGGSDSPDVVIDSCRLTGFTASAIRWNGCDASVVQNCVIDKIPAGAFGLNCGTLAAHITQPQWILNNKLSGVDNTNTSSGSTGISVTAAVQGEVMVDGNSLIYFGVDRAILNETEGQMGVNYLNGVLLIDD